MFTRSVSCCLSKRLAYHCLFLSSPPRPLYSYPGTTWMTAESLNPKFPLSSCSRPLFPVASSTDSSLSYLLPFVTGTLYTPTLEHQWPLNPSIQSSHSAFVHATRFLLSLLMTPVSHIRLLPSQRSLRSLTST